MATNKLLVAFGPEVTKVLSNLPKGTKSKFVNMCIEHVISDPALRNKLVAQLLGFDDEPSTNISECQKEEPLKLDIQTNDNVDHPPVRVPRTKFKF